MFVSLRNIDYYTTEAELARYLEPHNVLHVIIPNYTIPFRTDKRRPLGIAYAQFESVEQARAVAEALDGTKFRSRTISAKVHLGYDPSTRKLEVQLSAEYLLIPKVVGRFGDAAVREFFREYNPQEVFIFNEARLRGRLGSGLFGPRVNSVLVKVESDVPIEEIARALDGHKFGRSAVKVKRVSEPKVAVVIKKVEEMKAAKSRKGVAEPGQETEPEPEVAGSASAGADSPEVASDSAPPEASSASDSTSPADPTLIEAPEAKISVASKSAATEPVLSK